MPLTIRTIAACTLSALIAGLTGVPAGASRNLSSNSAPREQSIAHVAFSIRLEDQLLAVLNYLPVSFSPTPLPTPPSTTTSTTSTTTTTMGVVVTTTLPVTTTSPPPTSTTYTPVGTTTTTVKPTLGKSKVKTVALEKGTFRWRFGSLPSSFRQQWSVGTDNVILRGAMMRFQSVNNLPTTGDVDATTWQRLVYAAIAHQVNPTTYNVVNVIKASPEHLNLYANGRIVFSTYVNTGIAVSPTANGTYPVYLRYTSQTMKGTNPDGTHYNDPGIPWVSYFNGGDALHGFIRASYGWPQSLGCVEMPFQQAKILWPHTPIGTMVTVQ